MFGDPVKIGDRVYQVDRKEWGEVIHIDNEWLSVRYDNGEEGIHHDTRFALVERS